MTRPSLEEKHCMLPARTPRPALTSRCTAATYTAAAWCVTASLQRRHTHTHAHAHTQLERRRPQAATPPHTAAAPCGMYYRLFTSTPHHIADTGTAAALTCGRSPWRCPSAAGEPGSGTRRAAPHPTVQGTHASRPPKGSVRTQSRSGFSDPVAAPRLPAPRAAVSRPHVSTIIRRRVPGQAAHLLGAHAAGLINGQTRERLGQYALVVQRLSYDMTRTYTHIYYVQRRAVRRAAAAACGRGCGWLARARLHGRQEALLVSPAGQRRVPTDSGGRGREEGRVQRALRRRDSPADALPAACGTRGTPGRQPSRPSRHGSSVATTDCAQGAGPGACVCVHIHTRVRASAHRATGAGECDTSSAS
jgi:hypothetical protein